MALFSFLCRAQVTETDPKFYLLTEQSFALSGIDYGLSTKYKAVAEGGYLDLDLSFGLSEFYSSSRKYCSTYLGKH